MREAGMVTCPSQQDLNAELTSRRIPHRCSEQASAGMVTYPTAARTSPRVDPRRAAPVHRGGRSAGSID
eukprot:2582071-Karenia_brevis.AAC.1